MAILALGMSCAVPILVLVLVLALTLTPACASRAPLDPQGAAGRLHERRGAAGARAFAELQRASAACAAI